MCNLYRPKKLPAEFRAEHAKLEVLRQKPWQEEGHESVVAGESAPAVLWTALPAPVPPCLLHMHDAHGMDHMTPWRSP
jgi:hypothetical protein